MSVESAVGGVIADDELDEKTKKHNFELEKYILFTASLFTAPITMYIVAFRRDVDEIVKI